MTVPGGQPEIDLHSIRIIHALEETGSITAAARLLGSSQPAVSQHLQRAEARLGISLIIRTGRQVRLSEAGGAVARAAPAILQALDAAGQELAGLQSLRSGKVRMVAFATASSTLIPTIFGELRRTAPGVAVSYAEAEPKEATRQVLDGEADLALVPSYPGEPMDAAALAGRGLIALPRFVDEMLLVLPAGHALAAQQLVELSALEDDEWIAGCPRCRHHVIHACQHLGFEPNIAFETDNFGAVVAMVAAGLGVAILPRLALESTVLPAGAVVRPVTPPSSREIYLVVPRDLLESRPVAAVMSAITGMSGSPWRLSAADGEAPDVGPPSREPPAPDEEGVALT